MRQLDQERKRTAVIRCYLTRSEKQTAASLAAVFGLSSSDLVRVLLVTAAPDHVRLAIERSRWLEEEEVSS